MAKFHWITRLRERRAPAPGSAAARDMAAGTHMQAPGRTPGDLPGPQPQDASRTVPAPEEWQEPLPGHDPAWWDRQTGETASAWQERIEGEITASADRVYRLDAQREPGSPVSGELASARAAHMWALANGLSAAERASKMTPAAAPESADLAAVSWDEPLPDGTDFETDY
jgi:hypothetical protein